MRSLRPLSLVVLVALATVAIPRSADAQFGPDRRFAGFHVGMSGVGSTAALGVQGEMAYNENIGIGGWIDTWSYGESFSVLGSTTSWNVRYVSVAGTGSYHFPIEDNEKIDPFLGLSVGYFIVSSSVEGAGTGLYTGSGSRIFLGGHAGARYFFKESMSAIALIGVGSSYLTVGMDFGL